MSDILSQNEIEALLSSLNEGGETSDAPLEHAEIRQPISSSRKGTRSAVAYEVYDFRRPDKFSKEQLRTLQMLHETFGRLAGTGLSGLLRSHINIDLISLEQVPYEEYLRSISSSVFATMSIPPLSGQAALEMEFSLVFAMIDKLLGGTGKVFERNYLTEIESKLYHQIIGRMFVALKSAWEGVVIVNPSLEEIETSAQFVQIAPPNDIVVSILFEVRIGDVHGAMSLCIPYMVLKPITAKLSAQKWFAASGARKQTPAHRHSIVHQLHATSVDVSIRLGKCRLSVKDFLSLRSGDVLKLSQKTKDDLEVVVGDHPKYRGQPSLDGKNLAFHINSVIEQE